jgi:hypothetical protein
VSGAEVVVEHVRKSFEGGRIQALQDVSLRRAPGVVAAVAYLQMTPHNTQNRIVLRGLV